jgi:LysR family transcriptional activator of nhaA
MPNFNFNHLHYFHIAATEGSIAAAATQLGVTQPTVSEQLRSLERALGVELVERTSTGLKLTEAGRLAYEQTAIMFRAGDRLVEALGEREPQAMPTRLRVALSSSVSRAVSCDFLMPLLAMDACVPEIRTLETSDVWRELREGSIDLGLSESEPTNGGRRDLQSVAIDTIHLVVVAPPALTVTPGWRGLGLVHYRPSSPYHWDVEAYLAEHDLEPKVVAEADDPGFLLEAAARGGYLAAVPRVVARDALRAGRVKIVDRLENHPVTVHAVHAGGAPAAIVQRAVDLLVEQARNLRD